jgi:putative intracellular protease/amidase
VDGSLISGQNPASSKDLADKVVEVLAKEVAGVLAK